MPILMNWYRNKRKPLVVMNYVLMYCLRYDPNVSAITNHTQFHAWYINTFHSHSIFVWGSSVCVCVCVCVNVCAMFYQNIQNNKWLQHVSDDMFEWLSQYINKVIPGIIDDKFVKPNDRYHVCKVSLAYWFQS